MRNVITSSDGYVLTNGVVYGKVIFLSDGLDDTDFYEITENEYIYTMECKEATESDFLAALERFGVE